MKNKQQKRPTYLWRSFVCTMIRKVIYLKFINRDVRGGCSNSILIRIREWDRLHYQRLSWENRHTQTQLWSIICLNLYEMFGIFIQLKPSIISYSHSTYHNYVRQHQHFRCTWISIRIAKLCQLCVVIVAHFHSFIRCVQNITILIWTIRWCEFSTDVVMWKWID